MSTRRAARLSYNKMFVAYLRTFARMGLKAIPMRAETGPIGGDLSHEFIILAETGESGVFCNRDILDLPVPGEDVDYDGDLTPIIREWTKLYAATEDVHDADRFEREVPADKRVHTRGIEVGQIFYFGTKYSVPMKAVVAGPDGIERPIHGGSYGVGVSRLVGAIIEAFHDEAGIIWPDAVAPFKVAILNLKQGGAETDAACEQLYRELTAKGVDVLYDDLDERPGAKFATADLIGIPWQILVGPEGPRRGQGRGQAARRRQPRTDEPGGRGRAAVAMNLWSPPSQGSVTEHAARFVGLKPLADEGLKPPESGEIGGGEQINGRADRAPARSRRSNGCSRCATCVRGARKGFISVIAGFSFLGIMLGVATLIIVMAVMNGFRKELLDKILGLNGHLLVQPLESPLTDWEQVAERISKVDGIMLAAPLVEGQALASSPFNASGVLVRGVRAADLAKLPSVANNIRAGHARRLRRRAGRGDRQRRLADQLSLRAGDSVTLVAPRGAVTPMGTTPRIKVYKIAAVFEIGMSEYDSAFVFMPLPEAQAYFNRAGDVTAIEVYVDKPDRIDHSAQT